MARAFWCVISALMAVLAPMSAHAEDFSYDRYMIVVEPAPGREVVGELDMSFCEGLEKWDGEKRGCDAIKEPEEASEGDMAFYRAHRAAVGCSYTRWAEREWRCYVDRTADVRALDRAKIDKATSGMPSPLQVMAREAYSNKQKTKLVNIYGFKP